MKNKIINFIINVSRIIFGLTFLFSGFVKAIDPMGSAFKFIDYFRAFGLLSFKSSAVYFAVILAAIEFTIGFCVLSGCYKKMAIRFGLLFMIFFTPFTLYLAITNPVNDCGCFGDAIVLSNWDTFFKNILLSALIIILLVGEKRIKPIFIKMDWIPTLFAFTYIICISAIGLRYLPIIDFRPFKIGVNIWQAMQLPEQAEQPEHILVYEKDGLKKDFTLDNYPAEDSTWTFVETRTIEPLHKEKPAIADFFLTDELGDMATENILFEPGYTFLLISPDLEDANFQIGPRIKAIYEFAQKHGYKFYGVTVQDEQKMYIWKEQTGANYPYLFSDATVLETVIRSNPGLVLIKNGTILWKKSPILFPSESELQQPLESSELGQIEKYSFKKTLFFCIILFVLPILLLLFCEKTITCCISRFRKKRQASC